MSQPIGPPELRRSADQLEQSTRGRITPALQEKLPPVQRVGFLLVWAVLGLIAMLLAGILAYIAIATPDVTAFGNPASTDSLALYQKASDLVFERATKLIDQVVIKALLPILILLLGYIFGTRAGQSSPPDGG